MDMSRTTQKVTEALAAAQQLAVRLSHQQVDVEHVLAELLAQQDGLASRFLERAGASPDAFKKAVQESLARRPKVSGSAMQADKVYITQRLQQLLVKAGDEAEQMQDEYISVEHVLLAMIGEADSSDAGRIFSTHGISRERFLEALEQVRERWEATPDPLEILSALSRLLPDDTHLQQLKIRDRELTLRGRSGQASALIALLEQAPEFDRPRFLSPVTQQAEKELFHLAVLYRPPPEGRKKP